MGILVKEAVKTLRNCHVILVTTLGGIVVLHEIVLTLEGQLQIIVGAIMGLPFVPSFIYSLTY